MNIIAKWKEMREELRKFFSITIVDIAKNHGLAVEHEPGLPTCVDGFLDRHETPRFIVVNSGLPGVEQSYAICREVSRLRQEKRLDSMVLKSAKRWKLLDEAPETTRRHICNLDLEYRALTMLGVWGKGSEYSEYRKRNPGKFFRTGCIVFITDFLFFRLRIRRFFLQISYPFRVVLQAF
jgi:hypothetical protein